MSSMRTLLAMVIAVVVLIGIAGMFTAGRAYMASRGTNLACTQTNQVVAASLQAMQINQPALSVQTNLTVTAAISPAPAATAASVSLAESTTGTQAGKLSVSTTVGRNTCPSFAVPIKALSLQDGSKLVAPTPTP